MAANIDVRYTNLFDERYLRKWLTNPSVLHYFPMETQKEVDDAVKFWVGFSKYSASLTATIEGVPCGIATLFLMPYKKVAHHCLFKIVVDPKYQRKGVGTTLIRNLKHLAKNYFHLELIHAEVFSENPLIPLLQTLGFHIYAVQKGYIREGKQGLDKVLLECELTEL